MRTKNTPNISQLAARLQLSKGTISRILNDPTAPYAPDTRARVLSMASESGYRPDPVARALATGRTGNIAFWIADIRSSYSARIVQQFESEAEANNHSLIIQLFGRDLGHDKDASASTYTSIGADGIVIHGRPPLSWTSALASSKKTIPIVYTGTIADPEITDYVHIALTEGANDAMKHLIGSGRKRIAYLAPHKSEDSRSGAYFSTMLAAGLQTEEIRNAGETRAAVRVYLRNYIAHHGHPDALLCHNDDTAIAAYRALCDIGLRVPEDVALVGCDGIEDTEYLQIPISTILLPYEEMARLSWQFVKTRMQEPDIAPQRATLTAKFVARASSVTL